MNHRVFNLSSMTIKSMRSSRDKSNLVTRDFVADAIVKHAVAIAKEVSLALGANPRDQASLKLELEEETLEVLRRASEVSGLPMQRLLEASLLRATAAKPRARRMAKQR